MHFVRSLPSFPSFRSFVRSLVRSFVRLLLLETMKNAKTPMSTNVASTVVHFRKRVFCVVRHFALRPPTIYQFAKFASTAQGNTTPVYTDTAHVVFVDVPQRFKSWK